MSRSVLLQLAHDSIREVFEAKRIINKKELLQKHPLLGEHIRSTLNIYLDNELKSSFGSKEAHKTLLEDIIYNSKKAAFEDKNSQALKTSQYLKCEIEIILYTPEGVISQKDKPILL